jgi:hypothetical protein
VTTYLLSDRGRSVKAALAALALLLLCLYGLMAGPAQRFYYEDCLADPKACQGRQVLAVVRRVKSQDADGLTLAGARGDIRVRGAVPEPAQGGVMDVLGRVGPDGDLELDRYHLHRPGRGLKLAISLVPVAVVLYLIWRHFIARGKSD